MKAKKPATVISIDHYKQKSNKNTSLKKVLTLDIYKSTKKNTFAYIWRNSKEAKPVSEEFIAFCLSKVIEDIVSYNGGPDEVLELLDTVMLYLGYDSHEAKD